MALICDRQAAKDVLSLLYRYHKSTSRSWKAVFTKLQLETLNWDEFESAGMLIDPLECDQAKADVVKTLAILRIRVRRPVVDSSP